MDIKEEDSSEAISLEFNTEDQSQFFGNDESDHLVIHPVTQLDISSSALVVAGTIDAGNIQVHADVSSSTEITEESIPTNEKTGAEQDDDMYNDLRPIKSPVNVNQSWFTGKHAKESLQEQGHSWRQGMWSKEEVAILMQNIEDYVKNHKLGDPMQVIFHLKKEDRKDFYRTVAAGLNRPLFAVYRRVQRMYDSKNYVGKYSAVDIERLKSLRAELGNDWAQIGTRMGRSASSVKDKCRLLKESCHQGKWRFDEEERLTSAVYEVTNTTPGESITGGIPWQQVAEKVSTRTEKQCRAKWLNYLNWKHTGGTDWDKEDDGKLLDKIKSCNVKDEQSLPWGEMARGWKSVRSPQWLRSKWWTLKRSVPNHDMYGIPELIEVLKKTQRRHRLRVDRCQGQVPAIHKNSKVRPPTIKIARLEMPHLGTIKNSTLTLHLPIPLNQPGGTTTITTANLPVSCTTEQLAALAESFSLQQTDGTPCPVIVPLPGSSGIASISGNQIVVSPLEGSLQGAGASSSKKQVSVQLHQCDNNQLIITTNHGIDDDSNDADDLDSRVSLHDSHLGDVSDPENCLGQNEVDHLTTEMNQSDTDLHNQSQLIGTDAVLSSQQEVTTSELQIVSESSIQDNERTLVIVRSAPPSEGLVQPGSSAVENSVFTLSNSLLSCHNDHADLMDPSTDIDGKPKLSILPQS